MVISFDSVGVNTSGKSSYEDEEVQTNDDPKCYFLLFDPLCDSYSCQNQKAFSCEKTKGASENSDRGGIGLICDVFMVTLGNIKRNLVGRSV